MLKELPVQMDGHLLAELLGHLACDACSHPGGFQKSWISALPRLLNASLPSSLLVFVLSETPISADIRIGTQLLEIKKLDSTDMPRNQAGPLLQLWLPIACWPDWNQA